MRRNVTVAIGIASALFLLMWAPWITDAYAIGRVVEHLGGEDTRYNYLGEYNSVKEIPETVVWYPFAKAVYFPDEAVWFVTFYGGIV